jgi:hypothetical protein
VRESTHGVLRVAAKQSKIERVQVSGVVRAFVNVTDASHNFCDASPGLFVLQSNRAGPHKITWKPGGTGELECFVLLYCDSGDELIAEAYALTNVCATDAGGTGTGSEGQEVSVYDFRIQPHCTLVSPAPKVTNPRNHEWPAGSLLTMTKQKCPTGVEEWRVIDVELQPLCIVNGIEVRTSVGTGAPGSADSGCIKFGSVVIRAENCPTNESAIACHLIDIGPCDGSIVLCDLTWTTLRSMCCSGDSGSGGSGSGA